MSRSTGSADPPAAARASTGGRGAKSKGEWTAERILDEAESLFADQGFEATSLRQIASRVGIHEPGIYNHFKGKRALYGAVLDRALAPMVEAMQAHMGRTDPIEAHTELPSVMTDLFAAHPKIAALFHQALRSDDDSVGHRLIRNWLDRLFRQGMETLDQMGLPEIDRQDMAIRIIAMFNLTTGYFLSQRAFEILVDGEITDPENIARQKRLLARMVRSTLLE
jgi:AcrR family transcriptional regulator